MGRLLRKIDHLLLISISWPPEESRFLGALLSGLACSELQVAAFFAPPDICPAEAGFFVPDNQVEPLLRFCQKLRCKTGVPARVKITEKTLLEGSGWRRDQIQSLFLDPLDGRKVFYQGKDTFVACCDSWDEKTVWELLQA